MEVLISIISILVMGIIAWSSLYVWLKKIFNLLEEYIHTYEYKPKELKRKHSNIGQANFNNILQGRNNYDKYKNKDGLYEPVTGKKGIELKEKGE